MALRSSLTKVAASWRGLSSLSLNRSAGAPTSARFVPQLLRPAALASSATALAQNRFFAQMPNVPSRTILRIQRNVGGLLVMWSDGTSTNFDNYWLRESDPKLLHPVTRQRSDSAALSTMVKLKYAKLDDKNSKLSLEWDDGHKTSLLGEWLDYQSHRKEVLSIRDRPKFLWQNEQTFSREFGKPILPIAHYREQFHPEELYDLLEKIRNFGFVMVTNAPADPEATKQFLSNIGYRMQSIYGDWWDYVVDADFADKDKDMLDTAYTPDPIPPHTDGTYMSDQPGVQAFHVLSHEGERGLNTLVDGFNVMMRLKETNPQAFSHLTEQPVEWYHQHPQYDCRTWEPIVKLDSKGNLVQIRFNDLDRAPPPPSWNKRRLQTHFAAVRAFIMAIRSRENQIVVKLEPGTILLVNNWRLLHGRTDFTGQRRICGAYIGMDQFESRLRALERRHNFV